MYMAQNWTVERKDLGSTSIYMNYLRNLTNFLFLVLKYLIYFYEQNRWTRHFPLEHGENKFFE